MESYIRPVCVGRSSYTFQLIYKFQWVYKDNRITVYSEPLFRTAEAAKSDLNLFKGESEYVLLAREF